MKTRSLTKIYQYGIRIFSRLTWGFWERLGIHIVPNHFYYPIPDIRELKRKKAWEYTYTTEGINLNNQKQLDLLETFKEYKDEYIPSGSGFESHGDGAILHSMVRKFRPNKIVEVGSGYSTLVSLNATKINRKSTYITAIEPFPSDFLKELEENNENIRIIKSKVEHVPIDTFKELSDSDILFIDSSHVVTCGNDVNFLFLNVLPQLAEGVLVHVHDIRFPYEYPKEWLLRYHHFWNEQYLLNAFLLFNNSFEVLWAGHYMSEKYGERLEKILPGYKQGEGWPGSFWMRRVK